MKLALASAALLLASESVTTIGDFTYYEQEDPISDNLIAGVIAEDEKATLVVGCDHSRAKTIFVVLETQRFLAPSIIEHASGSTGSTLGNLAAAFSQITGDPFQYRVDKGESHDARSTYMGIQTAYVEGRDARAFAERLADGQSVFIRVNGANGYIDVRYDVAGIRPLLRRVAEKCGDTRLMRRLD